MEPTDWENKIKELEKENRILREKLETSEIERSQLEALNQKKEYLLKSVTEEFRDSENILKERMSTLEKALENQQTMQLKLIEAEKMSALGILVAGIAHEINNPVNFIGGNIDYANQYIEDLTGLVTLYQQSYPNPPDAILERIEDIELEFLRED